MIFTVTFAPAIDYQMNIEHLNLSEINRSYKEIFTPGGKGINVSIVLKNLDHDSTALGFIGGFTGNYILKCLDEYKIKHDFVEVKGNSRINVKIISDKETAINANGPNIEQEDINNLCEKLNNIKDGDYLVISGNVPNSTCHNIYQDLLEKIKDKKVNVVVDATKDLLLNTLKYKPFLIKPNIDELEEIYNEKLTKKDIIEKAQDLQSKGARNVIVSLGKEGSVMITESHEVYVVSAYKGVSVNTVGAGDSMIAGFISKYIDSNDLYESLKMASACGSATAFKEGLCNKGDINKLLNGKD